MKENIYFIKDYYLLQILRQDQIIKNLIWYQTQALIFYGLPKLGSNDIYKLKNHYNPSDSKTSYFTDIHFIKRYGTTSCSGYYYIDNIKYINNKNFNLTFGVAEKTNFKIEDVDGIIGLGYDYYNDNYSIIHKLNENNVTDSLSFSIKFEKDIQE